MFVACVVIVLLAAPVYGLFEDEEFGPRPEAMAGAFTAIADDVSAIGVNPAGLCQVNKSAGAFGGRSAYGGAGGLHAVQAAFLLPVAKLGTFGVRLQESGLDLLSERSLRFVHGFSLARDLAFGYGLNAYNFVQKDLGQGFAFGVDIGMFARIYRVWTVGFYAHNLNMPKVGGTDLPRLLSFGLGFSPSSNIRSALDIVKEPGQPTRLAIGQEFRIVEDYLTLRAGVQTEPVSLAFGLRTGYRLAHVDYAVRTHPRLPLSHSIGLLIEP